MMIKIASDAPWTLNVRVTPRSARNGVIKYEDGVLHLRLTAPPVEGAANAACESYLAELLEVSKSSVAVTRGPKSRDKTLTVTGISEAQGRARLTAFAPSEG